jgi:hypothetical protein
MVKTSAPKFLSKAECTTTLSDPVGANLRGKSVYFYDVGLRLVQMAKGELGFLLPSLVTIAAERLVDIIDRAENSRGEDMSEYKDRLTDSEVALFNSGFVNARELEQWKRRDAERLQGHWYRASKRRRASTPPL